MIIPVLCVSCSKVIADKYRYYLEEVRRQKVLEKKEETDVYFSAKNTQKTVEGQVLDKMGIRNPCCRRHFLTHVDI